MSTIVVTNHNENIYNIIGHKVPVDLKPPKYTSKFKNQVREEEKKIKQGHRTFGYAVVPLAKPTEYLKKKCRIVPPRPEIEEPRCLCAERRPPIPRPPAIKKQPGREDKKDQSKALKGGTWEADWKDGKGSRCPCPKNGPEGDKKGTKDKEIEEVPTLNEEEKKVLQDEKNFRVQNILNAIRSVPRQPPQKFSDTRRGDFHPLEPSGLLPKYIHKKTYGQTPAYLARRILEAEYQDRARQEEVCNVKTEAVYISDMERKQLLEGLKYNWEQTQKAFQLLPILTDTLPKIRTKLRLEEELRQLEHDIRTIERHKYIYVLDEDQ